MNTQLFNSFKWSVLGELASKTLPPLFYIITARILTPEDFGIVATSAMVIAFASVLWEAGLSKALIQNQNYSKTQDMSNVVLFTNLILSFVLYLLLFLYSDLIAIFFEDERISDVLKISGLSLIIGSMMSVQTALLQKDFYFKKLFYSRFVGALAPGIVSVAMAYNGYDYWALVYGSIASLLLQVLILWKLSSWRPTLTYNLIIAKQMFGFSKWILLSAVLSWFFIWGDIFVLGFFFTSHELGVYRTGNYFVGTVIGFITAPIVPVLYTHFSKIQHDIESVKKTLLFGSKVISFFVLPVGVGLYIAQVPLSDLIFGSHWKGLAAVIGYLGLMHSCSWIIGLNNAAYSAVGRPDVESKILIATLFFYLFGYIISAEISFEAFLIARFALAVFAIFFHAYASKVIFRISYLDVFLNIKKIGFVIVIILFINVVVVGELESFSSVVYVLTACIVVYLFAIYLSDKGFIVKIKDLIVRKRSDG